MPNVGYISAGQIDDSSNTSEQWIQPKKPTLDVCVPQIDGRTVIIFILECSVCAVELASDLGATKIHFSLRAETLTQENISVDRGTFSNQGGGAFILE